MSLKPEERELLDTAKFALDVMQMYEKRLVELGDPPHLVYSEAQKAGTEKAKWVIAQWEWMDGLCIGSEPFKITLWKDRHPTVGKEGLCGD